MIAAHKKAVATLELDNNRNQVAFSAINSVQDDVNTIWADNLQLQKELKALRCTLQANDEQTNGTPSTSPSSLTNSQEQNVQTYIANMVQQELARTGNNTNNNNCNNNNDNNDSNRQ